MIQSIKKFLRMESAGGLVLMACAAVAMLIANSPYAPQYGTLIQPWSVWINDGLMTIFFLMIGLEIKRELTGGELSTRQTAMLPFVAALGGIVVPALIYWKFNAGTAEMRGWAIPTATDIAFSLGVLALFGKRIGAPLKIFLLALAIIDDLAAVLIIAVFYTNYIALGALCAVGAISAVIFALNREGVQRAWPYLVLGALLWAAVMKSGVHATVAGVLLAWLMPMKKDEEAGVGTRMLHLLHPWVTFGILPIFALANAGVSLTGLKYWQIDHPVTLGIALGLFLGKPLGIFSASWLLIKCKLAKLPDGASFSTFFGVCMIAGIGFTMSLFIGALAFDSTLQLYVRLGVMTGSLMSAVAGCFVLFLASRNHDRKSRSVPSPEVG